MSLSFILGSPPRVVISIPAAPLSIGAPVPSVVIESPAPSLVASAAPVLRFSASPRVIVSGSAQGPAGPQGIPGTGVSHLEPRIADLEARAVLTGVLNW